MKIIDEEDNKAAKKQEEGPQAKRREELHTEAQKAQALVEYNKMMKRNAYPNWVDILAILGIVVVSAIAAGAVMFLMLALAKDMDSNLMTMIVYVLQFGLSILLVSIFQRYRGMKTNLLRFNVRSMNPPLILWGVVLIFIVGVVIEPLIEMFPKGLENIDKAIGRGGWVILTTVVFAPILEEMLFRGLILGSIREKQGRALPAVLISAVIFGVIHFNIPQGINAFAIGIILGYIYVRTNSLAAVILIHAINNGLAYTLRELFGSTVSATSTRELIGNDTVYWIVYGLCFVLFVVSLVFMMKALKRNNALPEAGTAAGENGGENAGKEEK